MSEDLAQYPEYVDSGVSWLGAVPAQWTTMRVKDVFREVDRRSGDGSGVLLSLTRARGLIPHEEYTTRLHGADDLSKYKVCRPNELVMNRMQAWSGMFGVANIEGLVSPDYSVFAPHRDVAVHFFEHLFKSPIYVDQFARRSKGIGTGFNRLYTPEFGAVPIAVPPAYEQHMIVASIRAIDRRVSRYIRAKRRLIELLNEQKQAIIHQAVTRGLDPNVRLKPSGVEWLGDVPEHWEVRRLKSVARIRYGLGQPPRELANGIPLIRATNVERGRIVNKDLMRVDPDDVPPSRDAVLRKDEIIVVRSGAYTGDSAIVTDEYAGSIAGYDMVLRVFAAHPHFIAFALLSRHVLVDQIMLARTRSAQPHLNAEELGSLLVLIPPMEEQETLAHLTEDESRSIELASLRILREIDLIREYRTRLIADIVTGKLDVRGVELPELDEGELLEEWSDDISEDSDPVHDEVEDH